MTQARRNVPPPLVAIASWLLPGAGYLLIGHRARGITVAITILLLFILGLLIGGLRVVEYPAPAPGSQFDPQMGILSPTFSNRLINQKPWFIGQILAGPIALYPVYREAQADQFVQQQVDSQLKDRNSPYYFIQNSPIVPPDSDPRNSLQYHYQQAYREDMQAVLPPSHARANEIGALYTAIAGMLNLLAAIDATYRASHPPDPSDPHPANPQTNTQSNPQISDHSAPTHPDTPQISAPTPSPTPPSSLPFIPQPPQAPPPPTNKKTP